MFRNAVWIRVAAWTLVLFAFGSASSPVSPSRASGAATVYWTSPTTIASDADVINSGTSIFAYDMSGNAETVNGISFVGNTSTSGPGGDLSFSGFNGGNYGGYIVNNSPANTLSNAYQNVLTGGNYQTAAQP